MRLRIMALVMALYAAGAASQAPVALPSVVMVSDIHFDPFHDPAKFARLNAAPAAEWPKILREPDSATQAADFAALQKTCNAKGVDTPMALLLSSLAAEKAQMPKPLFVTVSGDLMAHQFDCRFHTYAPKATDAEYSAFAAKTVAFVALELKRTFVGVPVYLALGNNDSGCKDYDEDENSAFLRADGEAFAGDVLSPARAAEVRREFSETGNYNISLPEPFHHTRLLVMQDIFQSKKYKTCAGGDSDAGAKAQIAWLRTQLTKAKAEHESVWVMAHIPPGVDAYSTFTKGRDVCATEDGKHVKAEMFLGSDDFAETIGEFADVIKLALFGHTHMDEMRFYPAATGGVPGKLVPSISPVNGNTPAFTVAQVDPAKAMLVDYSVFKQGAGAAWEQEYRYSTTYGEPDFSAASAKALTARFLSDRSSATPESQAYEQFYFAGTAMEGMKGAAKASALQVVWPAYGCSITQATQKGFRVCVCGEKQTVDSKE
jgi:sphingomyelin phosphodiesterase acid-like 3